MTDARTPTPSSPLERRWAVYGALLEGQAPGAIAARLRVSRQRVHEDVSYLVEVGAVRKISADKTRLRVERGEAALRWERVASETLSGDRRERSGLAIRAHHWRWSRAFSAGPERAVPWTGEAEASGVRSSWLSVDDGRGAFVVRAYMGKKSRRLQIAAPPAVVESGPDVLRAEVHMMARAVAVGEAFASRFGFLLVGVWRQSHPTEYAAPVVPGLAPFGAPGVSVAWADDSPGEGQTEPETRRPSLAAAWSDLPRFEEETGRALEELRGAVARLAARQLEHVSLSQGVVERIG